MSGNAPSKRVLVVDDLKDVAWTMASVVNHLGHYVEIAFDGLQAIAMIESFQPDMVLLDIGLPGMSGYEVCAWIKRQEATKHIRVVAITGYDQPEDRVRTAALGFERHFAKPIDPVELENLLKS